MKKYTKQQKDKLKIFWAKAMKAEDRFLAELHKIEKEMQETLPEIKELEFFWVDGLLVGIGNQWANKKDKYELLEEKELLKGAE